MFDTFRGLPLHALVIHATVVLLPAMALATIAVAVVPRLRNVPRLAWLVAVVDLLMIGLTWFTVETGQALQTRLGGQVAQHHADLASKLIFFVIAVFIAAVLVAAMRKAKAVASVAAVITSLALLVWTVQVGEAGSQAVWSGVVASTNAK